ncbi:MAG: hypothetical protein P1V51_12055 [Deltaproteobacteria bacterium]|nr:hypothetical protein [Deltaproteobacteria bacterium]
MVEREELEKRLERLELQLLQIQTACPSRTKHAVLLVRLANLEQMMEVVCQAIRSGTGVLRSPGVGGEGGDPAAG